ncbi:MAG: hypothetical protein LBF66_01830, partial [Holosporales bacterium]|nr:hypothetical protein [Holosporales bacterium]
DIRATTDGTYGPLFDPFALLAFGAIIAAELYATPDNMIVVDVHQCHQFDLDPAKVFFKSALIQNMSRGKDGDRGIVRNFILLGEHSSIIKTLVGNAIKPASRDSQEELCRLIWDFVWWVAGGQDQQVRPQQLEAPELLHRFHVSPVPALMPPAAKSPMPPAAKSPMPSAVDDPVDPRISFVEERLTTAEGEMARVVDFLSRRSYDTAQPIATIFERYRVLVEGLRADVAELRESLTK